MNVGNFISGSSTFSKPSLYIWKFLVHILLKPSLIEFEYNLTSMRNKGVQLSGSLNIKSKGEKERHKHLNAEFQRIARRVRKPSSAINAKK